MSTNGRRDRAGATDLAEDEGSQLTKHNHIHNNSDETQQNTALPQILQTKSPQQKQKQRQTTLSQFFRNNSDKHPELFETA